MATGRNSSRRQSGRANRMRRDRRCPRFRQRSRVHARPGSRPDASGARCDAGQDREFPVHKVTIGSGRGGTDSVAAREALQVGAALLGFVLVGDAHFPVTTSAQSEARATATRNGW